jgi:O-antigen ligase
MVAMTDFFPKGDPSPAARQKLEANNRLTMMAFFAVPPIIGPLAAVILVGGGINGWYRTFARNLPRPALIPAVLLALVFALFPLSEFVSWLVNSGKLADLKSISSSLMFLFVLPVYARLLLSPGPGIWRAIYTGAALACIGAGIFALGEVWMGVKRAEGGAGNPVPFAVVLSVLLPLALSGFKEAEPRFKPVIGLAMILGTVAIVLSGTRSMMLAALVNAVIVTCFLVRAAVPLRTLAFAAGSILVLSAVTATSSNFISRHFGNTLRDLSAIERGDYTWSGGQRIRMWQAGAELIAERPWLGYGPHAVTTLMREATAQTSAEDGLGFTHFHNLAINAWVRGGIFEMIAALAALLAPLALSLLTFRRQGFGPGQLLASLLFVTYLTNSILASSFWHDILCAFFVQAAVCAVFLSHAGHAVPKSETPV